MTGTGPVPPLTADQLARMPWTARMAYQRRTTSRPDDQEPSKPRLAIEDPRCTPAMLEGRAAEARRRKKNGPPLTEEEKKGLAEYTKLQRTIKRELEYTCKCGHKRSRHAGGDKNCSSPACGCIYPRPRGAGE